MKMRRKSEENHGGCVWPVRFLSVLVLLMVAGCNSATTPHASRATQAPTSTLGAQEALNAAYALERAAPNRTAGLGRGASMQPLYDANTVIIVEAIDFRDLEPGMLVAYRNSEGARVVHQLLYQDHRGWVTQGVGNSRRDTTRVTPANLEGVVYGAFFAMR